MNGKRWTERDTEILRRMNAVGYTDSEIGAITGHDRRTVERHRNALGLDPCHRVDWTIRSCRERVAA